MAPFFGNSVACRIAEAQEIKHSTLVLGDWRAAQRIEFYIGRDVGAAADGQAAASAAAAAGGMLAGEEVINGRHLQPQLNSRGGDGGAAGGATQLLARDGSGELSEASSDAGSLGQRSVVSGVGGFKIWVVNTHLDHEHPDNRQRQVGDGLLCLHPGLRPCLRAGQWHCLGHRPLLRGACAAATLAAAAAGAQCRVVLLCCRPWRCAIGWTKRSATVPPSSYVEVRTQSGLPPHCLASFGIACCQAASWRCSTR